MKLKRVINLQGWLQKKLQVGYGTRDKIVLKRTKKGKVYFLAKTYDKDIGELRSEVCASTIGRLFGFPVQRTWLCRIPQYKKLGLSHSIGVLIQLDVRRQRNTKRGRFREDLIHGTDLISRVDSEFAKIQDFRGKRRIYTLRTTINALRNYVKRHQEAGVLWDQFFELLAFDALIGGTDRHYYNWGVLEIADSGKFLRLAPAFDNGVSLLWKMDEYRGLFLPDLMKKEFPRKAQAMLKKSNGGRYRLLEVLEALYLEGDYKDSTVAKDLLARISGVRTSSIQGTLLKNVPQRKGFKTGKEELAIVSLYVQARLDLLKATLSRLTKT